MHEFPALPPRPEPPRRLADRVTDRVTEQVAWVGVGRLAIGAASMLVVAAGATWLLRTPPPTTESTLPVAAGASSAPQVTLPAPVALSTTPVPAVIVVHVAGAVAVPGIYEVGGHERVAAAVAAAGGAADDGDLDALNLAAPLADGQRVYVPRRGEVDPATIGPGVAAGAPDATAAAGGTPGGPIDLNTAAAADLESLPGIGPATAAAIVDDRARNGPFASVDDLDRVAGIGPSKLEALRGLVTT